MISRNSKLKTLYIVDNPLVALTASRLLEKTEDAEILLERKEGFDRDSFIPFLKIIFSNHRNLQLHEIECPSRFNLVSYSDPIKSLIALRKISSQINRLYSFEAGKEYVGAISSVLFSSSPIRQRTYIDHGWGEPLQRILGRRKEKKILDSLRSLNRDVLTKVFSLPPVDRRMKLSGFTPFKLPGDWFSYVDLEHYRAPESIMDLLSRIPRFRQKGTRSVLVLMSGPLHQGHEPPKYDRLFDLCNIELIQRNTEKDDIVYLKFHKTLFHKNASPVDDFKISAQSLKRRLIAVDEYIPEFARGYIPAEILVSELGIQKVVAESSATLLTLAHRANVQVKMDSEPFKQYRSEKKRIQQEGLMKLIELVES